MSKKRFSGLKIGLAIVLLLISAFSLLTFSACQKKAEVTQIEIVEETKPDVVVAGSLNISEIKLLVTFSDESSTQISAESSMLTTEGRNILNTPSTAAQNVTLYYKGKTVVLDGILVVAADTQVFKVTFQNASNGIIAKKSAVAGGAVVPPTPPVVAGETFVEWVNTATGEKFNPSKVTADVTVKAKYAQNADQYTVRFVDYKGNELSNKTYAHGSKVAPPSWTVPAEIESYSWGWDFDTFTVTQNITFEMTVKYAEKTVEYFYAFSSQKEVKYTLGIVESVRIGNNLTKQREAESKLAQLGFTFIEWQTASTVVNTDTKMIATVEDRNFTISYKFSDHTKETVLTNTVYTLPSSANVKPGYDFTGKWKDETGKIHTGTIVINKDFVLEPEYQIQSASSHFLFTFKGLKDGTGDVSDKTETVVKTTNYGDKVNFAFVTNLLDALKKANPQYADYSIESISYSEKTESGYKDTDVTSKEVVLGAVTAENVHQFSIVLVNKNLPTAGLKLELKTDADNVEYYVVTQYTGTAVNIYIPDEKDDIPIRAIAANVFKGKTIYQINIGANVVEIGDSAFENAVFHTDVILPDLKTIGACVFKGATVASLNAKNKTKITVTFGKNSTFTIFPADTFNNSKGISKVVLPASVKEITARDESMLTGTSFDEIEEINLDNVSKIGNYAFWKSTSLANIGTLKELNAVGEYGFAFTAIETLEILNLTAVGTGAFSDMTALTAIVLGGKADTDLTFDIALVSNNIALGSITLGANITNVVYDTKKESSDTNIGKTVTENTLNLKSVLSFVFHNVQTFTVNYTTTGKISSVDTRTFFLLFPRLKAISVTAKDGNYLSDNGVVYEKITKDETTTAVLKFYPSGKLGDFTVPETVGGLTVTGFGDCILDYANINTLKLSNNVVKAVLGGSVFYPIMDSTRKVASNVIVPAKSWAEADLKGNGEKFVAVAKVADSLHFEGTFSNFDAVKNTEKWADNVYQYDGTGALSRYDAESGLVYKVENNKVVILSGDRYASMITVPASIGGVTVAAIAPNAFANYIDLKTLIINANLTSFDNTVLTGCTALEMISAPSWTETTKVTGKAFEDTLWYQHNTLLRLGNKLVAYISHQSEDASTDITSEMLDGIVKIPDGFFANSNVTEIAFPNSLTEIGKNAFNGAAKLAVVIFNKVRTIGESAFAGCKALTDVTLTSVIEMGAGVFVESGLVSVKMPNAVNKGYVPFETFKECNALENVSMPEMSNFATNEAKISNAFNNCASLSNVDFLKAFTRIPQSTFSGCAEIVMLDFTQMVTKEIGEQAFAQCVGLEYVLFGSNITFLGASVFSGCSSLTSVKFVGTGGILASQTAIDAATFPENTKFYVPAGIDPATTVALSNFYSAEPGQNRVFTSFPETSFEMLPDYTTDRPLNMPSIIDTIYMEKAPVAPAFVGYLFDRWFVKSGARYVAAEFPLQITGATVLYAKYFSMTRGSLSDEDVVFDAETETYSIVKYTNTSDTYAMIPSTFDGKDGLYPITGVYAGAFANCTSLKNIVFPEGIKTIMSGTQSDSSSTFAANIEKIVIPASVTTIYDGVFANLSTLDLEFATGSNLLHATQAGFVDSLWYKNKLADAKAGKNNGFVVAGRLAITYAGESVAPEVPGDVIKLSEGLFNGNGKIEEIVIGNNLQYIGDNCFINATALKTVSYSAGSSAAGSALVYANLNAFTNTPWVKNQNMVIAGTILIKYNDLNGDKTVAIPDYITEISEGAFRGSGMESVVFGAKSALKTIGNYAFENTKLKSIVLPATVTSLGKGAFRNNSGLESADFSKISLDMLSEDTFRNCTRLTSVKLSPSIQAFGAGSIANCIALAQIESAGLVKTALLATPSGEGGSGLIDTAFYKVSQGETDTFVILGKVLVKYIAGTGMADENEEDIFTVTVPEGVEIILASVFLTGAMKHVVLPESLRIIERNAFDGCSQLTRVEFLGANVTAIGDSAFASCTSLNDFAMPNSLLTIGDRAFENTNIDEVVIPDGTETIGAYAFTGSNVEYLKLGSGLKFIGEKAFYNCYKLYKVEWSIATADLDELNQAIVNVLKESAESYSIDMYNQYIVHLFGRANVGGQSMRMYLAKELFNYIENSSTVGGEAETHALAWKQAAVAYKIFNEESYPLVTFATEDNDYYMPSFNAEVITEIATPAKTGHTFMGWYTDGSFTVPLELPYRVYHDMTLYPKWFKNDQAQATDSAELGFVAVNNEYYYLSAVQTTSDTLYIPSTVAGLPVKDIRLNANVTSVTRLILTNAGAFNEMQYNIFYLFNNLKELVLISADGVESAFTIIDGVLYSRDESVLIAYIHREVTNGEVIEKDTTFTIPDRVTTIMPYAFFSSGLTTVTMGKNVTTVGKLAFNNELTELIFPDKPVLKEGDSLSFNNTAWYKHSAKVGYSVGGSVVGFFYAAGNMLLEYEPYSAVNTLALPNTVNGINITVIAGNIYAKSRESSEKITFATLKLPQNLMRINSKAFFGIEIQNIDTQTPISSLIEIADDVFSDTYFYKNTDYIVLGKVLLKYISTVPKVVVDEGIVAIANDAFNGSQLSEVVLPTTLKTIGQRAFYNCEQLSTVSIPNNVTFIGDNAFAISGLKTISFSPDKSKLETIGVNAFANCTKLVAIDIPYTVKSIGDGAFMNCNNLSTVRFDWIVTTESESGLVTEVKAKSLLTNLGKMAFYNNTALTSIEIPNGLTSIQAQTFYNCKQLRTVKFDVSNSNVKVIETNAFYNCENLGGRIDIAKPDLITVVLPNKLEVLQSNVFENCKNLLGIQLNYNLKTIGENVFLGCLRLTKIAVYAGTPATINDSSFTRAVGSSKPYYNLRIYVNHSENGTIKAKYQQAWRAYGKQVFERSELPELTYRKISATGATEEVLHTNKTDILVNPTQTFGSSTTYSAWTYASFGTIKLDDNTFKPVIENGQIVINYSNDVSSENRYGKAYNDPAMFPYQLQVVDNVTYNLLILDYDYMVVSTK